VLNKFKEAINNGNTTLALSIQKYIINKIMQYKYPDSIICNMNLPANVEFTGMEMNKLLIMKRLEKISDSQFLKELNQLHELNPNDSYVSFNLLLNTINKSDFLYLTENNEIIQSNIEKLYSSTISKDLIDALNIKYQIKIIASNNSNTVDPRMQKQCLNILKEIVNIKETTIENTKKLAEIYIENEEYKLAAQALEQWVTSSLDEELLFTYISLCSLIEWDMHTQKFNSAMTHACQINKPRFCELFYSDKFSYRIFENSIIKDLYCETCQTNE